MPLILVLDGCAIGSAVEPVKKPNVVVLVGDDIGFHGCMDIPTPHLDALAKSGVKFISGYVSAPYCSPTRAGLLTGRYQTRFGHESTRLPVGSRGCRSPNPQPPTG